MVYHINKRTSDDELKRIFDSLKKGKKGVNVKKYAGKVKARFDPLTIQRKLRNEWS